MHSKLPLDANSLVIGFHDSVVRGGPAARPFLLEDLVLNWDPRATVPYRTGYDH